jgi:hypothetical protein
VLIAGGGARARVDIVSSAGRLDPAEGVLLCSLCLEDDCNVGPELLGVWPCETSGRWEAELDCDKLEAESFFECPRESSEESRFDLVWLAILSTQARRRSEGLRLGLGYAAVIVWRPE